MGLPFESMVCTKSSRMKQGSVHDLAKHYCNPIDDDPWRHHFHERVKTADTAQGTSL